MAAVQAAAARASFLFEGDLNGHHQEWLGSTTTNPHGVAALDFATVSGCVQLVQVFHDRSLLLRSFWSFVLPVLEYCSVVWCSAADSHLKLLDRVVRSAGFLAGGVLECNLGHRRSVAEVCMLFMIKSNP